MDNAQNVEVLPQGLRCKNVSSSCGISEAVVVTAVAIIRLWVQPCTNDHVQCDLTDLSVKVQS